MGAKCQSCGIPLSRDANGGGTNMNGSRSDQYCSLCFQDGLFVHPEFSVTDMQHHCIERLANRGIPRFMARIVTRGIPSLDRWRSKHE